MFSGAKDFIRNKIITGKKFVAGANLVALMGMPVNVWAEEQAVAADSVAATNPADYFEMCVEKNIKWDAQLYKFHKASGQERQKLRDTNYDLWSKLYKQEKAVHDKCQKETLDFSERSKNVVLGESDIEKRGYMCDDLMCDMCVNIQCLIEGRVGCTKKCEDVLKQNITDEDELVLLNNAKKQKLYFIYNAHKTNGL